MQLEQGVRFELRLMADTPDAAVFEVELRLPAAQWVGEASIAVGSGAVTITFAAEQQPPAWCTQAVHAALRSLFRDRLSGKRYPARVTRWRGAPSAEDAE